MLYQMVTLRMTSGYPTKQPQFLYFSLPFICSQWMNIQRLNLIDRLTAQPTYDKPPLKGAWLCHVTQFWRPPSARQRRAVHTRQLLYAYTANIVMNNSKIPGQNVIQNRGCCRMLVQLLCLQQHQNRRINSILEIYLQLVNMVKTSKIDKLFGRILGKIVLVFQVYHT